MILKLEKYLFYFLLFSIPFQTRKILYYSGWRFNEWQSVSVYATDMLLGILLVFWLLNIVKHRSKFSPVSLREAGRAIFNFKFSIKSQFQNFKNNISHSMFHILQSPGFYLTLFIIFSALSLKNSGNLIVGGYQLVKLVEFAVFFFYLKNYAIRKFTLLNSLFVIFYGGLFQAVIAIWQFLKQSSLGLGYLGESVFDSTTSGVASFYNFYGEKIIRAYGTTPHSNVLAAYLFLAIFAFYFIWFYRRLSYDKLLLCGHLIALWAFFLTFARVALFLLGVNWIIRGFLLFIKFRKFKSKRAWRLVACTVIIMAFFAVFYWPEIISRIQISGEEEAVRLRSFYNKESLETISWTGTGIGDFINELAEREPMLPYYLYQPVHNIFLLINSETGILGISAFVLFLVFLAKDLIVRTKLERFHHYSLALIMVSFLFMGLFDHFLWTLQQGRFIFWMILALMAVDENEDLT